VPLTFPVLSMGAVFLLLQLCIVAGLLALAKSYRLSCSSRQAHSHRASALSLSSERSIAERSRSDVLRLLQGVLVGSASLGLLLADAPGALADTATGDIPVSYDGVPKPLSAYLGKKGTLIVNVASQCALTPQYEGLVSLYKKYAPLGLNIVAFPCNQFASQEPFPVERIRKDMARDYGVQFPILDKIDVNGAGTHPLYSNLKSYKDIGVGNVAKISWNFEKFLV
jgi:glutathione peroxidase